MLYAFVRNDIILDLHLLVSIQENANYSNRKINKNIFEKGIDMSSPHEYNYSSDKKGGLHMSPKKMGRPVSPDSKHTMFRVRLDDKSMKKMDECAENLKITRSDVVRKGIDVIHENLDKK